MSDPGLINQNRVQKMDCDPRVLGAAQHQLECVVHQRTDTDCHVFLTRVHFTPSLQDIEIRREKNAHRRAGSSPLQKQRFEPFDFFGDVINVFASNGCCFLIASGNLPRTGLFFARCDLKPGVRGTPQQKSG